MGPIIESATRRELLRRGLGLAGVAAATGSVDPALASARPHGEAEVLRRVLRVELVVIYAYTQVLGSGVLSPRAAGIVGALLVQEQRHVQKLDVEVRRRGGRPVAPPTSVAAADKALTKLRVTKSLSSLKRERDALKLLTDVEEAVIGAYYVGISMFTDPKLVQSAAEAMANEGQHYMILRRLLHPHPVKQFVTGAFVEGKH